MLLLLFIVKMKVEDDFWNMKENLLFVMKVGFMFWNGFIVVFLFVSCFCLWKYFIVIFKMEYFCVFCFVWYWLVMYSVSFLIKLLNWLWCFFFVLLCCLILLFVISFLDKIRVLFWFVLFVFVIDFLKIEFNVFFCNFK